MFDLSTVDEEVLTNQSKQYKNTKSGNICGISDIVCVSRQIKEP